MQPGATSPFLASQDRYENAKRQVHDQLHRPLWQLDVMHNAGFASASALSWGDSGREIRVVWPVPLSDQAGIRYSRMATRLPSSAARIVSLRRLLQSRGKQESVGFKFKLEESLDPAYKVFRDLVVADKDIKIIHLQREDILDQYISLQATRQTGVFLVRSRGKRPKLKPFDIDVPDLISYVREARRKQEAAEEMNKDHDCLHLTYEELCESQSAAYQKILSFLEVPHASLSTTMVKVLKKNTDLVLNLDQVNEALARDGSRTMSKL
ncbi:MAG: hypothetical protein F4Y34_01585 [Gammaproteobacteria bacterium]|nr:hypothetical protein [Gammaproteobacteria bacterium]MYH85854.1 hypothetical protein [Gammaproteobacteria bacterium]